jgi:hypothetical protein
MSKRISSASPSQRLLLPLCSTLLVELELSFSSQIRGPCSTFLKSPLRSPPAPSHLPPHPAKRRRHLARRRGFKIMLPPVPLGPDHHIQLCAWGGADPPVSFLCMRSRVARRRRGHRMGQLRGGEGNAGPLHDAGAAPRRRGAAPALLATAGETSSQPALPLVPAPPCRPRPRVLLSPAPVGRRSLPCSSSTGLRSDNRRGPTSSVGSLMLGAGGAPPSLPPATGAPSSAGRAHQPSCSLWRARMPSRREVM